jgi:hypothetical protein
MRECVHCEKQIRGNWFRYPLSQAYACVRCISFLSISEMDRVIHAKRQR